MTGCRRQRRPLTACSDYRAWRKIGVRGGRALTADARPVWVKPGRSRVSQCGSLSSRSCTVTSTGWRSSGREPRPPGGTRCPPAAPDRPPSRPMACHDGRRAHQASPASVEGAAAPPPQQGSRRWTCCRWACPTSTAGRHLYLRLPSWSPFVHEWSSQTRPQPVPWHCAPRPGYGSAGHAPTDDAVSERRSERAACW